mmetsp:Transcript_15897/g.27616  ORF Transcript_15897/g.27616 Transcript_15897/m.27616 type:complete len:223 (-) Transcript_15897:563-1231(-)
MPSAWCVGSPPPRCGRRARCSYSPRRVLVGAARSPCAGGSSPTSSSRRRASCRTCSAKQRSGRMPPRCAWPPSPQRCSSSSSPSSNPACPPKMSWRRTRRGRRQRGEGFRPLASRRRPRTRRGAAQRAVAPSSRSCTSHGSRRSSSRAPCGRSSTPTSSPSPSGTGPRTTARSCSWRGGGGERCPPPHRSSRPGVMRTADSSRGWGCSSSCRTVCSSSRLYW